MTCAEAALAKIDHTRGRKTSLVLGALGPDARKALLTQARPCHFPTGKVFFRKGAPGDALLLIETGQVEISLTAPGGEKSIVAHLGAGDCVGEMAVLTGGARTADARATIDVTGRLVTRALLMRFLADDPKATLGMVADLCEKLQATTEALADVFVTDGATRLAKVLFGLFSRWGQSESAGGLRLKPAVSQSELGEMAGLSRETVNRQIKAWEVQGLLRRDGRDLVLMDEARFAALGHPKAV